jgi:hypothetical protein
MPIPDGSVVITPRQMYDELQGTRRAVEALTATVDPALSDLRSDLVAHGVRLSAAEVDREKMGNRITALETAKRVTWAGAALLFAAAGVVMPILLTR